MRRICIVHPNKHAYSETFIRDQIARFRSAVIELYGAWFPVMLMPDTPIVTRFFFSRLLRVIERSLLRTPLKHQKERVLLRLLIKKNVDVVLAHYGPTAAAIVDVCERANTPLFLHVHGFDIFERDIVQQYDYDKVFQQCSGVICGTMEMVIQLTRLGCPPSKIRIIPCGVDTHFFRGGAPANAEAKFVAVGRFVPKKSPQHVIISFALALKKEIHLKLVMVGDGPLLDPCRQLVEKLRITENVTFAGVLSPADIADLLRTARGFIQHSVVDENGDSEGTGVSILEAMATGLPIIGTRHGGLLESVVEGRTGFLVDEHDVDNMAAHIVTCARDPDLCQRMGAEGRARAEELYSIDQRVGQLEDFLLETLSE